MQNASLLIYCIRPANIGELSRGSYTIPCPGPFPYLYSRLIMSTGTSW